MNLRAMQRSDILELKMIHHKYYRDEFKFPDFEKQFLNAFVVEHNEEIVTVGGLRLIPEAVAMTNKEISNRSKLVGLNTLLEACIFTAHDNKFDEFTAFIQDPNWREVLTKRGFSPTKGDALVFGFEVNHAKG